MSLFLFFFLHFIFHFSFSQCDILSVYSLSTYISFSTLPLYLDVPMMMLLQTF